MTDVKKQSSETKQDETLREYYLQDYNVTIKAHDIDEAIEIAKSKVKKDEGDK